MKRTIGFAVVLSAFGLFAMSAFIKETDNSYYIAEDQTKDPIVVLELFTSQGCSSCPPADELLARVKRQSGKNIFALSYHVNYWNYIGWEDPFSSEKFTDRQSKYNKKFGYNGNYTPQLVVNGKEHFVGSDASRLEERIRVYGGLMSENGIEISKLNNKDDTAINFDYTVDGPINGKLVRAILVIDKRTTMVKRGENRNRRLTNNNIVVNEVIEELNLPQGNIELSIPDLVQEDDKLQLIVLIENRDQDITGAGKSDYLQ